MRNTLNELILSLLMVSVLSIGIAHGQTFEPSWPSVERWRAEFDKEYYCSTQEVAMISSADLVAQRLAASAFSRLQLMRHSDNDKSLFVKWFGTYSEQRLEIVLNCYSKIRDIFREKATFSYRCRHETCDFITRAYVTFFIDTAFKRVYLCPSFFRLKRESERAGDIVHELSHMVANTDDRCSDTGNTEGCADSKMYGKSSALDLAKLYPHLAVDTAENYQYFAEEAYVSEEGTATLSSPTGLDVVEGKDF